MQFKKCFATFLMCGMILLAGHLVASGAIPHLINYQGKLTDHEGNPVADGTYNLRFNIYGSESGMDSLWWESHSNVQVTNGIFSVILGANNTINLSFDSQYWLEVIVGAETITPRRRLTSVGYAFRSWKADTADYAFTGGTSSDTTDYAWNADSLDGLNSTAFVRNSPPISIHGNAAWIMDLRNDPGNGQAWALHGYSKTGNAIVGESDSQYGILGNCGGTYAGVKGQSTDGRGVHGSSTNDFGVLGQSVNSYGVYGKSTNSQAGYFYGPVTVTGYLTKSGGGFKIDHPLDPENKYLYHSFVESPDMMNVYNGNVVLDANGEAVVRLPIYFEALNRDFRYQLTCIGDYASVYIAEEVSGNTFKIAGGKTGIKVSWQVTGVRKDPFAEANRIQVEVDKSTKERGKYLHPRAYGLDNERGVHSSEHSQKEKELW